LYYIKAAVPEFRTKISAFFLTETDTLCFISLLWNEKDIRSCAFFPIFFSASQHLEFPHRFHAAPNGGDPFTLLYYIKAAVPEFRTKISAFFFTETDTLCFISRLWNEKKSVMRFFPRSSFQPAAS